MFLAAGCNRTHSQSINSNSPPGNVVNQTAVNKSLTLETPKPTPVIERQPVNEADYTVAKFDYAKMRATTLDTQPLDIIKKVGPFDPEFSKQLNPDVSIEEELKKFSKYKIKTAEFDFNHDGTAERIILSHGEIDGEIESLNVFIRKDEQWDSIFSIEGNPDEPKVPRIEILTSANRNNFDLIKLVAESGAGDDSRDIRYYKMLNGHYEAVDCYFVDGVTKESDPCSSSRSRYN